MNTIHDLKTTVRLSIVNPQSKGDSEFGRGIASLCQGVREKGSLNAAAKSMGMAYSKAWRIVKSTEEALDIELLNRDGAHGSSLTPEGEALLDAYVALSEKMQAASEAAFDEYWNG